jgi:hypothetical protein
VSCLIGSGVQKGGHLGLRLVLHQDCLDPVVVPALVDLISDQGGVSWLLGALRWVALG